MRHIKKSPKKLPLVVAMVGCLYGAAAIAQPQSQQQPPEEDEAQQQPQTGQQLDRITVTGSLLRRVEFDSTSPVQVVTAETEVATGKMDVAEFLQQSSIASSSMQLNHQFSGFVVEGGTGVQSLSLRGLGAQRTLVLLNGSRPGPAGTRGQVGSFDLNVIPSAIIQRVEILKDGGSSIYGSDALAGVANVITRRNIDRPEITASFRAPFESGGDVVDLSAATGWNFGGGNIAVAASYYAHSALKRFDRDFLACPEDMVWDADGNRVDREDRSIIAGSPLSGCNNLYVDTVIDAVTGVRYIPSPDGQTIGMIPGYRPRRNQNFSATNPQAFYEDVLNFDFVGRADIINRQERVSLYGSADFALGSNVNWTSEVLYNQRKTEARGLRQFFPLTGGATAAFAGYDYANSPDYVTPVPSGIAQPIMPFYSDQDIKVDYIYVNTGFDGTLPFRDWTWSANASHSRSKGDYSGLSIRASVSGDVEFDDTAPRVDYFHPDFLSGRRIQDLVDTIGVWHTGTTTYEQTVFNGVVTGELFDLPAGAVAMALGGELRKYSIDDQPSELSRSGDLWGQSSADVTKGDDTVKELFTEIEVPLLKGLPAIESLTLNMSGRWFKYDSVEDSDNVWKLGLGWRINPSLQLRATKGTSFRAPGLYELYLGNQTAFASQLSLDPCINWNESTNDFIRANCAAAGIPDDYTGAASSATVITGGGAGVLRPETSNAFTAGIVFTPTFAPLSIAVDYFSFEVQDQISTLGSAAILGGCYGSPVYPNNFCSMFDRNAANHDTDPFKIERVRASYVNVNRQKTRGYDLLVRYDDDFSFGRLTVESQFTKMIEDAEQLFDPGVADGFETDNRLGIVSRPKLVGNVITSLRRGDWTYNWGMRYVGATQPVALQEEFTYLGRPNTFRDITADSRLYHSFSVNFQQPNWSMMLGLSNAFDKAPPTMSTGTATRYGNVPAFATQYDYYGRTLFARYNYRF